MIWTFRELSFPNRFTYHKVTPASAAEREALARALAAALAALGPLSVRSDGRGCPEKRGGARSTGGEAV